VRVSTAFAGVCVCAVSHIVFTTPKTSKRLGLDVPDEHVCVCVHVCVCMCMYVYVCACLCMCMFVHVHVCACVRMCVTVFLFPFLLCTGHRSVYTENDTALVFFLVYYRKG
jgi:hypothetical protein